MEKTASLRGTSHSLLHTVNGKDCLLTNIHTRQPPLVESKWSVRVRRAGVLYCDQPSHRWFDSSMSPDLCGWVPIHTKYVTGWTDRLDTIENFFFLSLFLFFICLSLVNLLGKNYSGRQILSVNCFVGSEWSQYKMKCSLMCCMQCKIKWPMVGGEGWKWGIQSLYIADLCTPIPEPKYFVDVILTLWSFFYVEYFFNNIFFST